MPCTDQNSGRRQTVGDVAEIQPGYLSRSRVEATAAGAHRLVQAKDVAPNRQITWDEVTRFIPERAPDLYEIGVGDVLVLARGRHHRATLIVDCVSNVLASSVFYILRPDRNQVVPSYLEWWINLPDVQSQISAASRGTAISYLKRRALSDIGIDLPPMRTQERIEALLSLNRRRESLQTQLDQKRHMLINAVCRQAAGRVNGYAQ